jgi:segregation and condensation protein B
MALKARVEAIIYAAEEPVTIEQIASLLKEEVLAEELRRRVEAELADAEAVSEIGDEYGDAAIETVLENAETAVAAEGSAEPASEATSEATSESEEPAEIETSAEPEAGNGAASEGEAGASAAEETEAGDRAESAASVEAEEPSETAPDSAEVTPDAEAAPGSAETASDATEVPPSSAEAASDSAEASVTAPAPPAKREAKKEPSEEARARAIIREIVRELVAEYESEERGIEIKAVAGGYRMATKPEHHDIIRAFSKSLKPPVKLSLAALETLAVIAYKQPVTVPEISEIRGVESGGVIATLLDRKLVTTGGRKQVVGRPILYKTSKEFLLRFGLNNLGDLPSMEEFEKLATEVQADLLPAEEEGESRSLNFNRPEGQNPYEEAEESASPEGTEATPESSNKAPDAVAAAEELLAENTGETVAASAGDSAADEDSAAEEDGAANENAAEAVTEEPASGDTVAPEDQPAE